MKKNNKQLYEKIMRNIAREIKHVLNENILNFNVDDYQDIDIDIIDHQTIDELTFAGKFQEVINNIKTLDIKDNMLNVLLPELNLQESDDSLGSDFLINFPDKNVESEIDKLNILKKDLTSYYIFLQFYYEIDFISQEYDLSKKTAIHLAKIIKKFFKQKNIKNIYNVNVEIDDESVFVYLYGPEYAMNSLNRQNTNMSVKDAFNTLMRCLYDYIDYLKKQNI